MSGQRKALKVLSILLIVLSVLGLAGGIVSIVSGSAMLSSVENVDQVDSFQLMALMGSMLLIMSVVALLMGIFGVRGANNPKRIMPVIVLSAIGVAWESISVFATVGAGGDPASVLSSLVPIIPPLAFLILAGLIRKNREDIDGVAGSDGAQYPDGFNPKKLGFMRVLQVLFALNIVFTITSLTLLIKGNYELGFAQYLDFVNLIFDGLLFWFIWQRSRAARPFAIGFSLFNIIIGTGYNLAVGDFNFANQLFLCLFDLLVLFYFIFSRRAKAILVQPFSSERVEARLAQEKKEFFNPKKWSFWRSVIIYFCLFCIVGHWMEAGLCLLIKYGIVPGIYDPNSQIWHDWLYPFPVYGFGTVACILLLFPIKNALQKRFKNAWAPLVLSFIINMLVCSAIELTLGLIQNQPVDGVYPLWDYSDMFCNFMGQICLQNSLAFGMVATLMTWVVYPGLEKLMIKLPNNVANVLFIVVVIFFLTVFCLYCVNVVIPGL